VEKACFESGVKEKRGYRCESGDADENGDLA